MTPRRLVVIAVVLLLIVALAFVVSPTLGTHRVDASTRVGAAGAPALASERSGGAVVPSAPPTAEEQALARAYAALGAASDGDDQRLRALDPLARARLDEARRLLDDPATHANSTPPRADPGTAAAMPRVAMESGGHAAAATIPDSAAGAAIAAAQPSVMTLDLAHAVDPRQALRDAPDGPELLAPGLWAKVPFRPDQRPRLVVADRSDGGYAVALYGGDFSTIRLDGGLVVPGRFYHVHGNAVITGGAACSVDIRPLAAVPAVAEQPARPPQSNG